MTSGSRSLSGRCLLIAPLTFYSFHRTVADGLRQRGYEVDLLNEEFPANAFGKVLGKLALPLLRRFTVAGLRRQLDGRPPYDLVVIIKGRGLGPEALDYLRSRSKRIVGYNFDSFRFNPSPLDWRDSTHRFATFDIVDARNFGVPLVHLFSAASNSAPTPKLHDVSIVQRVHSDRLFYADLLLRSLPVGATSFVFLYESSLLTFALGVVRHPWLYARLWPHISFKPLPYAAAMAALSASRVTFDYAHPQQSGITVRCFEAQSLGVAILTNNQQAVESGFFAPGSVAHLPRDADVAAVRAVLTRLLQSTPAPRCRSLDDFLDDLLGDEGPQAPTPSSAHSSGVLS